MNLIQNLGILFLALWLIIWSTRAAFPINSPNISLWFSILAVLAGLFLILFRLKDKKALVNVGMLLLSVYLVLSGLIYLLNVQAPGSQLLLSGLAVIAGLCFLPAVLDYRSFYSIGLFFLGLWLLAMVLVPVFGIAIPSFHIVLAIVAITASLLLLLGM